jgi:hypothetical protein
MSPEALTLSPFSSVCAGDGWVSSRQRLKRQWTHGESLSSSSSVDSATTMIRQRTCWVSTRTPCAPHLRSAFRANPTTWYFRLYSCWKMLAGGELWQLIDLLECLHCVHVVCGGKRETSLTADLRRNTYPGKPDVVPIFDDQHRACFRCY